MDNIPDRIDVNAHERLVEQLDYLVAGGQVWEVNVNDFAGDVHLEAVDEIPPGYFDRWEGDDE